MPLSYRERTIMRKDWALLFLVGANVLPLLVLLGEGQPAGAAFVTYLMLVAASAGFDADADGHRRSLLLRQLTAAASSPNRT
jgi:hypothetical protein